MRIAISSDHAAFEVKQGLVAHLSTLGHRVEDLGPSSSQPCDYPLFAEAVAVKVAEGTADKGVILCGNGIGMSIAANKVKGVRAALCYNEKVAVQTRQHNDSNVAVLPGREFDLHTCTRILDAWLGTAFTNEARHARRVDQIREIEERRFK